MDFGFIFLFTLLGLFSGLIGGLLGIGGGVITVPALYFIFLHQEHLESPMQVAVCTSLATAFITTLSATFFHLLRRGVSGSILKYLLPGLAIGCILGALTGHYISSYYLSVIFGAIAICLGVYFFFPNLRFYIAKRPNGTLALFSPLIGLLSSLLGIGGGSVTFPILLGYQVPVSKASGTSSASTMVSAFIGTLTYLWLTRNDPHIPNTFGYIDIWAFVCIGIGSILTSPIGVKLSHTLNVHLIKRIFGVCLVLIGVSMWVL